MANVTVEFRQINLHRSQASTSILSRWLNSVQTGVCLIQEPWTTRIAGRYTVCGLGGGGRSTFYATGQCRPRACIVTKGLAVSPVLEHTSPDLAVARIRLLDTFGKEAGSVLVSSAYLPHEARDPPGQEVRSFFNDCGSKKVRVIMGLDCNAHHTVWGSKDTNARGESLLDFLATTNLQLLNRGDTPTFAVTDKDSVIDITVCSPSIEDDITRWKVLLEPSLSDHRTISFRWSANAAKAVPIAYRNPRTTNWVSFHRNLEDRLGDFPRKYGSAAELEHATRFLTAAIISSYEEACPLKERPFARGASFWNKKLENLRRENRRLFNRAYKAKSKTGWDLYKEHTRSFKKAIAQARKDSWVNFCEEIISVPKAARLHKILSKKRGPSDGQLLLDTGEYTSSDAEALGSLLRAHIPGFASSGAAEGVRHRSPFNGSRDWALAAKIATRSSVEWAIGEFAPFKTPGSDGIFPALLQQGLDLLSSPLVKIFRACLAIGYVPDFWKSVRVIYIPKAGRAQHVRPKDYRPISLTSFLLKCLEKLVDRYIRDAVLSVHGLHPSQHAYRAGRSTVSALHNLVGKIEKGINHGEYVCGAFLDIQGAFDSVPFHILHKAMIRYGVPDSLQRWIWNVLTSRDISSTWGSATVRGSTDRGCPQGGVLSPLLWCLVVDEVIFSLNSMGIWCQAYADDVAILASSISHSTAVSLIEDALKTVAHWCRGAGLSVNPSKTEVVLFTRKYKVPPTKIRFGGKELTISDTVKYLGVVLDKKLSWDPHTSAQIRKATAAFWACRGTFSKSWGLKPHMVAWFYSAVVKPLLLYAAVIWWKRTELKSERLALSKIQRLALLGISGAMSSTPTAALEAVLGFPPLHVCVEEEALLTAYRLNTAGLWHDQFLVGHASIWNKSTRLPGLRGPQDCISKHLEFSIPPALIVPLRSCWEGGQPVKWKGPVWFTDGSKTENGVGSGFTRKDGSKGFSFTLENHNTVFQAEVYAILACTKQIRLDCPRDKNVYICADNQAALQALCSPVLDSELVSVTRAMLDLLREEGHKVHLVWVPGHSGIFGNERADYLAREGAAGRGAPPDSPVGIAAAAGKSLIKNLYREAFAKNWAEVTACRQAKDLIGPRPSPTVCKGLLRHDRRDLRVLVGILTGHCRLNYHLRNMKVVNTANCRFCELQVETSAHILCSCEALAMARKNILGDYFIPTDVIKDVRAASLLHFLRRAGVAPHL